MVPIKRVGDKQGIKNKKDKIGNWEQLALSIAVKSEAELLEFRNNLGGALGDSKVMAIVENILWVLSEKVKDLEKKTEKS